MYSIFFHVIKYGSNIVISIVSVLDELFYDDYFLIIIVSTIIVIVYSMIFVINYLII